MSALRLMMTQWHTAGAPAGTWLIRITDIWQLILSCPYLCMYTLSKSEILAILTVHGMHILHYKEHVLTHDDGRKTHFAASTACCSWCSFGPIQIHRQAMASVLAQRRPLAVMQSFSFGTKEDGQCPHRPAGQHNETARGLVSPWETPVHSHRPRAPSSSTCAYTRKPTC